MVVVRVLRRLSAWALPRPSASASAKLAKSTVSHSQMAIWASNATACPWAMSTTSCPVTSTETTHTERITGLRSRARGSSLRNESSSAARAIVGSSSEVVAVVTRASR